MRFLFLLVPLAALGYVMVRIYNILPFNTAIKTLAVILSLGIFIAMIVSFIAGLEKLPLTIATIIYEITTSWLFILLYLFMIFLLFDILRAVHIIPKDLLFNSLKGTLIVIGLIVVIFAYGNARYYHKYRKEIAVQSRKPLKQDYKIVMMSDLHIGYHNQRGTLSKWIDMINEEHADLILIAGDIIDISTYPINLQRSYEEFKRLNAPVYACLGNHEYISGLDKTKEFYRNAGITLLIDSVAEFNDDLLIAGRNDRSDPNRKTIPQILQNQDINNRYTFIIDHQPYNLEQSEQAGADFQFSGHTHYGQVFPINLITKAVYEKAYGSYKRSNTDYYISSGLGIWGGKFRIGTKSEYVVLNLHQSSAR